MHISLGLGDPERASDAATQSWKTFSDRSFWATSLQSAIVSIVSRRTQNDKREAGRQTCGHGNSSRSFARLETGAFFVGLLCFLPEKYKCMFQKMSNSLFTEKLNVPVC